MSVDILPLAVWSDEAERFIPLGLHLLPEYYAREAARFAAYRWGEWLVEDATVRVGVVGHYFAQRLYEAHEHDEAALMDEADAARATRTRAHRG